MRVQASVVTFLFVLPLVAPLAVAGEAQVLPSRFEADRVYVMPRTPAGAELRLFTDTGGGLFLRESAVRRLGLVTKVPEDAALARELGDGAHVAALPVFATTAAIPMPSALATAMPVMPDRGPALPGMSDDDGMLGQAWFAGGIWTWDYPKREFRREAGDWRAPRGMRRIALGFRTAADGKRETDFPRMQATIDGKQLSLLLDTGATTVLTPTALAALDDGAPAERATSMIVDTVFQAWRRAHPDWRVIEEAQAGSGSAMIEVPEVVIAGHRVGPVWFTHRPDANFHEFMSGMMDARVDGALGGNAFRSFVMSVDYPDAAAWFRCVVDCRGTDDDAGQAQ